VTIWDQLDRRAVAAADSADRAPLLYGWLCEVCGHLELGEDPLLIVGWRECPSCSVRGSRNHGRT
jgi:rubrerythrin